MVEGTLRVAQLNVGSLLEPDWDRRREEIAVWLERLGPDIVCFQEVWESDSQANTAAWFLDRLAGPWHLGFGGFPFAPGLWADQSVRFGSAVLSRWPVDVEEAFSLPVLDDEDPIVAWVPWELVHVRTAGLDVFSTHLAAAPQWAHHRRAQVVAIDAHVRAVRGSLDDLPPRPMRRTGVPAIVCGDFNAEPDSDEMRFLTSLTSLHGATTFYQDAWRAAGDGGPGWTQDWRRNPTAAAMNVHPKRIDYVLVGDPFMREGSAGRVLSAHVAFDTALTGVMASDHFGLVVDIAWPDRP